MSILSNTTLLNSLLEQVNNLPEASDPELQDKTITPSTSAQSVTADEGYDGLGTVTVEAMTTATQATPSISVDSTGLITASATQTAGYVSAGTKSSTYQLAFQAAKTITPTTASQIAVSSGYYTGGNVVVDAIPSSYVVPSGTLTISANGTHDVTNYASAVVNVESSGSGEAAEWSEAEDAMVTGTLSVYSNDRVTSVGNYAFAYASTLTSVDFPNVSTIGSYAFYSCANLTTVSFPVASYIGGSAFYYCRNLTSVSFPVASCISNYAFYSCANLTTISFPVASYIGIYVFYYCSKLTTASFPVCSYIGNYAFQNCFNLTSISFPVASYIGSSAFYSCRNLTTISFPVASYIRSNAFYYCSKLTSAYFGNAQSIMVYAFSRCFNLSSLTLGGSTVCTLTNSNAFTSTPYAGYSTSYSGTPWIYVPSSLVASYQAATNWTYFSSYFSSIESLEGANLISFTLNSIEYQAEEGMTWAEWDESDYSPSFNVCDYNIYLENNSTPVDTTDEIISGASYIYELPE